MIEIILTSILNIFNFIIAFHFADLSLQREDFFNFYIKTSAIRALAYISVFVCLLFTFDFDYIVLSMSLFFGLIISIVIELVFLVRKAKLIDHRTKNYV